MIILILLLVMMMILLLLHTHTHTHGMLIYIYFVFTKIAQPVSTHDNETQSFGGICRNRERTFIYGYLHM